MPPKKFQKQFLISKPPQKSTILYRESGETDDSIGFTNAVAFRMIQKEIIRTRIPFPKTDFQENELDSFTLQKDPSGNMRYLNDSRDGVLGKDEFGELCIWAEENFLDRIEINYTFFNKRKNSLIIMGYIIEEMEGRVKEFEMISKITKNEDYKQFLNDKAQEHQLSSIQSFTTFPRLQYIVEKLNGNDIALHWRQLPGMTSDATIFNDVDSMSYIQEKKSSIEILEDLRGMIDDDKLMECNHKITEVKNGVPFLPKINSLSALDGLHPPLAT